MEHSEFMPPQRQSLTDQEISQQLGAAQADEAGMLAAMDFLEQQTKLREMDNASTEAWLNKMRASSDPRAVTALENLERAKLGLPQLPLISPVPEFPVFNPSTPIPPVNNVGIGSTEESVGAFDDLIRQPVSEVATGAVEILGSEFVTEDNVSDELDEIPSPVVKGFRLVSAANWVIGFGVLVPAVGAGIAAVNGLNFVTSILAGLVGVLVGVKVNIFGLVAARRTKRGLAVASRASFGVFGAIVPGVLLLLSGLFAIGTIAFASGKYFNNTIVGLADFKQAVLKFGDFTVSLGTLVSIGFILVAGVLAIFGGSFVRWTKIVFAALILLGFVGFAVYTISGIDYMNLAGVFQPDKFLVVAPIFALVVSVFTYGLDGESLAAAAWGAKRKTLTWPIFIFGFLLPLLSYGHIAAILNGHDYSNGIQVIQQLLGSGNIISSTILVNLGVLAVIGLLLVGVSKLIEALKTLGTNHVGYGLATIASLAGILVISTIALLAANPLGFGLAMTSILLIPAASWLGVVLTETLIRRGRYHDASLTRSYGFYGAFNWVAIVGFVITVVAALSLTKPIGSLTWLGFLSGPTGLSFTPSTSALLAIGFEVLFTLATAFPRIIRQQLETKTVEDRKFDLVDVVVE
jgi:NCS1 family nucleobase:cation symporter-1